jgi:hypothetical protein
MRSTTEHKCIPPPVLLDQYGRALSGQADPLGHTRESQGAKVKNTLNSASGPATQAAGLTMGAGRRVYQHSYCSHRLPLELPHTKPPQGPGAVQCTFTRPIAGTSRSARMRTQDGAFPQGTEVSHHFTLREHLIQRQVSPRSCRSVHPTLIYQSPLQANAQGLPTENV